MSDPRQLLASDPERSVFVSANAGTGKTKVLIERVLRLLLREEMPDTILCVTFTNAAAAEIQERLNDRLAKWAVMSGEELMADVKEMTGRQPSQEMMARARRLFAEVIDNDQGPRVETTHSFCQSLLSRFPVEAGVPPQFKLISEGAKDRFLQEGFASLFSHPDSQVRDALSDLVALTDSQSLMKHVRSFVSFRELSDAAIAQPFGFVPEFDSAMTALSPYKMADISVRQMAMVDRLSLLPLSELAAARPDKMAALIDWLAADESQKAQTILSWQDCFLTKDGTIRAKIFLKKQLDAQPDLEDKAHFVAQALIDYQTELSALMTAHRSRALYVIGRAVALYYAEAKQRAAMLDYDDLIIKADKLLSASEMMAWVRWKLDYGINHMLVDEAQDTNSAQWALLSSLADEFFVQEKEEARNRTLFSVGDFKQSIYSFQGAEPLIFLQKEKEFEGQAKEGGHLFSSVSLTRSYRSSKAILDVVNDVMMQDDINGLGGQFDLHEAAYLDKFGLVEIWPITEIDDAKDAPPFMDVPPPIESQEMRIEGADAVLAQKLADHIQTVLEGKADGLAGHQFEPRDIMVLVRKRDKFFALLRAALVQRSIAVAGADRLHLSRQIEISDLLALADICLLHDDDLQLASLLKSPLIGLDEEALMHLAMGRPKYQSLFTALKAHGGAPTDLGSAVAKIEHYLRLSVNLSVAGFFETVLAQGGRDAFYKRLGTGVDESLNAFIRQAYDFEAEGGVGLSDFVAYSRAYGGEIKRDLGNIVENQVRIMTIHGSKGLQAPIIYLPDTLTGIEPSEQLVRKDNALFWPADLHFLPPLIEAEKEQMSVNEAAEHQRLLYVAMTRAASCLFITGWQKSRSSKNKQSWFTLISQGIEKLPFKQIIQDRYDEPILRYCHEGKSTDMNKAPADDEALAIADVPQRYPWAFTPPIADEEPIRPLVPSAMPEKQKPEGFSSPNAKNALLEGLYQHYLLEELSPLPASDRQAAGKRLAQKSATQFGEVKESRRLELADHMVKLTQDSRYEDLFTPQALIEFQISGIVGTRSVIGQIDRLVIYDDRLWLVDFKSGAPKTDNPPQSYILQLALYADILGQIYPDKPIQADIIWLADFSATSLSAEQRQTALQSAQL